MTFCKGELRKGDQLIFREVEVSISTGQLILPQGQKLKLNATEPLDLKLKDGSTFTIYIEKRTASYTPKGSTESYSIRAIPNKI